MPNYGIALTGGAPEVESLNAAHARVASMKAMMQEQKIRGLEIERAERGAVAEKKAIADDEAARGIFSKHIIAGPDGTVSLDKKGALAALYQGGHVKAATALQAQMSNEEKERIANEKGKWENVKTKVDILGRASGAVRSAPEADRARVYASERAGLIAWGFNPEELPEQYDPALVESGYLRSIEAKEQATNEIKRLDAEEEKRNHDLVDARSKSNAELQAKTSTANAELQAKTSTDNSKRSAAVSRENSIRAANTSAANAALKANAIKDGKPPTTAERKELGFYLRATEADSVLEAGQEGMTKKSLAGQVRYKYAPNVLQSEENQNYKQAQRSFTEARLRKESGAAIPPHEYEADAITYFPQPGDKPEHLEQKRRARRQIIRGMRLGAGRAMKEIGEEPGDMPDDPKTTSGGGKVKLKAPNGQTMDVSADEVEHYIAKGAKKVN